MSWNVENIGTPEEVTGAIDEAMASSGGMPQSVGTYLKDAIAACTPQPGTRALIFVKSSGHRPTTHSSEISEVRLIKSGPWKTPG